tara:strand:+ start:1450 stop:1746 length:297 start_codon:yes stop_codon:yes gene_type:complete
MHRNTVSIILSMIFLVFLVAPTVIAIVDDSIDISVFYITSEEEEKGAEKNKNSEVLFLKGDTSESFLVSKKIKHNTGYYFKNYQKPHLNLISPPPDLG